LSSDSSQPGCRWLEGFERATGRYTLFFDADDVLHPVTLTSVIEALDETGADVAMMPY
jgi:hypothetical protein